MSTKNVTSSTQNATYNPASMSAYNSFLGAGSNVLMDTLNDPLKASGFNQRLQLGNTNAFNLFNRNNSNIMQRASMFGGRQMPGFLQNQLTQSGNQLASTQAANFNSNLLYADQLRQQAMGQALGYHPLQTGSTGTQTQTTGGLGTWLPQVAGMGLSLATAGLGGGMLGGGGMYSGASNTGRAPMPSPGSLDPGPAPSFSGVPGGTGSINPWGF